MKYGLNEARKLYDQGAGGLVSQGAQTLGAQRQALDYLNRGGSGLNQQAGRALSGVMAMDPYAGSQNVYDHVASRVQPSVNAQFSAAGRTGSPAHQDDLTQSLTQAYAPFAMQMHQQGVSNQLNAAAMAPSMDNAQYADIDRRAQLGAQIDGRRQAESDQGWAALDRYQNYALAAGGAGGTAVTSKPGPSRLQTGLGGAMSGAATGFKLSGGNPYGAAIGAGAGLLGGLF